MRDSVILAIFAGPKTGRKMMIPQETMLRELYRKMLRIRKFEYRVKELFSQGKIPGFVHLYVGEEAVAVGVCANLRQDDYVTSTHRGHGHCIAKGAEMKRIMAELFGRETGYCKGKGGSMHVADFEMGMLGANGMVAAGLPLATGAGLSIRLRETDQVAACFFGDGAVDQGTFHESLNLASLWKLPVIFICENNSYFESTHISRHLSARKVADFAASYRIPGVTIDGNDVIAVYQAVLEAVKRARSGLGPTLIECITYRWEGHEEGEPWTTYRTVEEVEEWKKRCPLKRMEEYLTKNGVLTDSEIREIEGEVDMEVEESVRFAEESPWPQPEEALKGVFVSPYY